MSNPQAVSQTIALCDEAQEIARIQFLQHSIESSVGEPEYGVEMEIVMKPQMASGNGENGKEKRGAM